MTATVTSTGNAGVHVQAGGRAVFVDAFWEVVPRLLGGQRPGEVPDLRADLILVTHAHWDHFDADCVGEAAARTGAAVAGPEDVIRRLRGLVAEDRLFALEPPAARPGQPYAAVGLERPGIAVTAFRTCHGRGHNSYLVRMGDFAFFDDADNEDTRPLDPAALGRVDALLLCPWQGSAWVEFVERLQPRQWLLIHLSREEIAQHRAGRFLPDLCDRVPLADRTLALAPGEAYALADHDTIA